MRKKKIHTPGVGEEIGVFQPTVGEREVWGYGDVGEGNGCWGEDEDGEEDIADAKSRLWRAPPDGLAR